MIRMLTPTCRQSLSSLFISTTVFHSNVQHKFYCNYSIIQYPQLNPYVHVSLCVPMLTCCILLFMQVCVCLCVRVCVSVRRERHIRKLSEHTKGLIFPPCMKKLGPHLASCVLKHHTLRACFLLEHSPFHCEHESSSGFQRNEWENKKASDTQRW